MKRFALFICLFSPMLSTSDAFAQTTPPSTPATSSTPAANYDVYLRQAEQALQPAAGKNASPASAIAFLMQAVKIAPDDDKKYRALLRAATIAETQNDFQSASSYYDTAWQLKNLSGDQKAQAKLGRAFAQFQLHRLSGDFKKVAETLRKNFEDVLLLPEASTETKIQTHNLLADFYLFQAMPNLAAAENEKVIAQLDAKDTKTRPVYFARAFENLKNAAPAAATLALGERLLPLYLAAHTEPMQVARIKNEWAQILSNQNEKTRALALWNEIADNTALPVTARGEVLRSINRTQRVAKDFTGALATADRLAALPAATPEMAAWRGWDRASTFSAQGDEEKMRAELQTLIASPQILPGDKAVTWTEIAKSYNRQQAALPASSAVAATLREGAKKAYEAVWNMNTVSPQMRVDALVGRSQLDVDAKNFKAATDRLLTGITASKNFRLTETEHHAIERQIYFSLAVVYEVAQQRTNALTALVGAQQNSAVGDTLAAQSAITLSQQAYAAKDWVAARNILTALKSVWGLPHTTFLVNRAQIEVGAQNWPTAKKALDELASQRNLSAAERKSLTELRAKLPTKP